MLPYHFIVLTHDSLNYFLLHNIKNIIDILFIVQFQVFKITCDINITLGLTFYSLIFKNQKRDAE